MTSEQREWKTNEWMDQEWDKKSSVGDRFERHENASNRNVNIIDFTDLDAIPSVGDTVWLMRDIFF